MPSRSLLLWRGDRAARLDGTDAQCAAVPVADVVHLEECLRGYVMHLSAHFQGFGRDLYSECARVCVNAVPAGMRKLVHSQFTTSLALEKGNPSNANLRADFSRFGLELSFTAADVADRVANGPRVTDLGHFQVWRNRAIHQNTDRMEGGIPADLTLPLIQKWRTSCDGLATSLDDILYNHLVDVLGIPPW